MMRATATTQPTTMPATAPVDSFIDGEEDGFDGLSWGSPALTIPVAVTVALAVVLLPPAEVGVAARPV